jgi:hypothetical protein
LATPEFACVHAPPAVWLRQWKRSRLPIVAGQSTANHHQFTVSCVGLLLDAGPTTPSSSHSAPFQPSM